MKALKQLARFVWREKAWWLVPLAAVLGGLALLMALAQSSSFVPFVYTLF